MGTFNATLTTAGTRTLTATDQSTSSITGHSGPIVVGSATAPTHFVLTPPFGNNATAGNAFAFIVQAEDQFNNQVLSYNGSIHFATGDSIGTVPPNSPETTGFGVFAATLRTTGNQTVTVNDPSNGSITPATMIIHVSPNVSTHFLVTPSGLTTTALLPAPGVAITGTGITVSVTAMDAWNNTATGYSGITQLTSSDGAASISGSHALTGGVGTFTATLNTMGSQTLTASDTVATSITGSAGVAVRDLVVTTLTPTTTGFTAVFSKTINNPSGPNAINLYDSADAGYGAADVTLFGPSGYVRGSLLLNDPTNPNAVTFVKTSTFNLTTVFNPGSGLLPAGHYTVTLRSASNAFTDTSLILLDGNNSGVPGTNFVGTFNIASPAVAVGVPAFARGPSQTINLPNNTGNNISMTNGTPVNISNGAGVTSGNFTLQYNAALLTITGAAVNNQQTVNFGGTVTGGVFELAFNSATTGPIAYSSTASTLQNNIQTALTALSTITAEGGVTVSAFTAVNVAVNFSNLPGAANTQPTMSAFSSLTGTSPTVQVLAAPLPVGSTFTLMSNTVVGTSGTAVLAFTSPTPLNAGPQNLGEISGMVPMATQTMYGAKAILHFSSESLNGGTIPATNDDAVQAVAFLGDASGDGVYSPLDPALIARVATGLDSGFGAYGRLDPVIVGDINTSGTVDSTDSSLLNRYVGGTAVPQIPTYPTGLTIAPAGPDPTLSVLTDLQAAPGATVTVPVNIDTAKPDGSTGMTEAILALQYDPQVFSVSPADVQLGALPQSGSGWHLTSVVNAKTGQIGIDLFSTTPILTTAGGSLVTISLHVRDAAPAGATALSLVSSVSPTGQQQYQTEVADAQGAFVLHAAVTACRDGAGSSWTADGHIRWPNSGALGR